MTMQLNGMEALQTALLSAASFTDVKNAVKLNGSELDRKMKRNASFDKGYQTGTTKRSINMVLSNGGLTATVGPTTEYSPYLEYGTRFMAAQPFVAVSYHSQKPLFIRDLERLME